MRPTREFLVHGSTLIRLQGLLTKVHSLPRFTMPVHIYNLSGRLDLYDDIEHTNYANNIQ
ncbi:hypothetical protein HanRHA438_Chr17g0835511 [Helianthus annuus]|nr:hypothetical protein HanRHA438_Chr17g0835511 [Helianthus annuus]